MKSKSKTKTVTPKYWGTLKQAGAILGCDPALLGDLRAAGRCPTAFRSGRIYDTKELRAVVAGKPSTTATEPGILPDGRYNTPVCIRLVWAEVDTLVNAIRDPACAVPVPEQYRVQIAALISQLDDITSQLHAIGQKAFPGLV
ncbi:MAG: hypothetical protein SFY80_00795 [Verrucomicrobiota bacterium]|nr:hypothetical protein [Verrucomicrobiota bacterium]